MSGGIAELRARLAGGDGPAFWRSLDAVAESPEFRAFLDTEYPAAARLAAAPDRYEPVIEALGRVGYLAKAVAFAVAGGLVVFAAVTRDISTATGLDGALNAIGAVPAGQWLLTAVAVGFAAFGVYALARARYPDRDPAT